MQLSLTVIMGPGVGQRVDISRFPVTVGRNESCGFRLPNDPTISREHLRFSLQNNQVFVEDLRSTTGTHIDEVSLRPERPVPLPAQCRIRLGQTLLEVHLKLHQQPTRPLAPPVLNGCHLCGAKFSLLGSSAKNTALPNYCNACAKEVERRIDRFRYAIGAELNAWDGRIDSLDTILSSRSSQFQIDLGLALNRSADITTNVLQRVLTFMLIDGHLEESEEQNFHLLRQKLHLPEQAIPQIAAQVRHYALIRDLRNGKLPTIRTTIMLPAGEIAHYEAPAVFKRELTSKTVYIHGRIIVTSSRIIFSSTTYPFESPISKVQDVTLHPPQHFFLQLSKKNGTGLFQCAHSFEFVEIARSAIDISMRRKVLQQAGSRSIPQDVRAQVFARDGGRCVQCGAMEYLEFDHIIPFSKGGASTIGNVTLLCRACNLAKSNKI